MNELMTTGNNLATTDPAAVAAAEAAKARIQSAYMMAISRPRSYDQSRVKILNACRRPSFAEKVEYRKPCGGKNVVTGPSIRFAEMALREWGNISYENQVVYDDENTRRISITITDLETNTTFSASIQIAKTVERSYLNGRDPLSERVNSSGRKVYTVRATDDELLTKQAAAVSKALRNEGLRLIPQDIVEEALEAAREALHNRDKGDPDAAIKKLADAFARINIEPKDLEEYLKHPLNKVAPSELQDLRAIYQAVKDGQSKWSDYVHPEVENEAEDIKAASQAKIDRLKDKIESKKA